MNPRLPGRCGKPALRPCPVTWGRSAPLGPPGAGLNRCSGAALARGLALRDAGFMKGLCKTSVAVGHVPAGSELPPRGPTQDFSLKAGVLGGNCHKSAEPMGLRDQGRPQTLWKSLEPLQLGSDITSLPIEATLGRTMRATLNPRQGTTPQATEHAGSGHPWPLPGSHGAARGV